MSLFKDRVELGIEEAELETKKTFEDFPPLWRWLIIIMIVAIIPGYFIAKGISQKTWARRYQQTAIFSKPSFQNPESPKMGNVNVTTLGPGIYAAAVKITNPNLDLSLNLVPYTFNFYNNQKQLVYSYSDKLYLLPDQTKYITAPRFTTQDTVAFTDFVLPEKLPWQKRLSIPQAQLITSTPNAYEQFSPLAFVVEGDFLNNSPYNLKQVHLTFLLTDPSGTIIGVSQRDEFTIKAFERRGYKQLWPGVTAGNLDKVAVTADTNVLDPNNLSVPAAAPGGAGDLSR